MIIMNFKYTNLRFSLDMKCLLPNKTETKDRVLKVWTFRPVEVPHIAHMVILPVACSITF